MEETLACMPWEDTDNNGSTNRHTRRRKHGLYGPLHERCGTETFSSPKMQDVFVTVEDEDTISLTNTSNGDFSMETIDINLPRCDSNHSLTTDTSDFIHKRLLKYGIVPLEKKSIHGAKASPSIKHAVDDVNRFLFVEGGHFCNVEALMTNYCQYISKLGIPVDRLYYGGIGLHPKLTAFIWKWTPEEFSCREMPQHIFERRFEIFSPHEPFCVLERGLVDFVRIKHTDDFIPPDTATWFRGENYTDYLALPDIYRSQSQGSLAWATKDPKGFTDDHISFFELTLPALSTVLRLHTNDLVLRTLTERMELEIEERTQELAEANQQLEEANNRLAVQAQKQLQHFACMSHEIRTPLNCIVGISSLLLESKETLTEEVTESIQMVHSSAELLNAVVDDVLDYSKMESGVFEVDIRSTNLQDTLNAVVHAMQEKAAKNNVRIVPRFGPTLPELVETDPRRLQQVMYNLLGNACKFSKSGGKVELKASLEPTSSENQLPGASTSHILRFAIKDYGKGIDEKDFESIFLPFNQGGKETQTVYGGTGLGLSITSSLVDRLGGRISVDSKLGEFSEFVVELPFQSANVDVAKLSRAFKDTTIVILETNYLPSSPFHDAVIREFDLDVVRARSWEHLNDLKVESPERKWLERNCIVVSPSDAFETSPWHRIRDGTKSCRLITYGGTNCPKQASIHWKSLQSIFPTVALTRMVSLLDDILVQKTKDLTLSDGQLSPKSVVGRLVEGRSHVKKGSAPRNKEEPIQDIQAFQILIAEDNMVNQKVLTRVLKRLGIESADCVENGKMAVEAASTKVYDLIFMDMQMPIMDGLEATRLIKEAEWYTNRTKLVFCTAHAVDDFREQANLAGGDGFISKPFNFQKIEACLKEYLPNYG